ncbi:hypothetical protein OBBRIDRAFT_889699 [Obba rivulosa]|uniref:F-box domain-containing protein n=1 Tax=Obba rivulosa TaxID=1052685 RepID=A0A8E2DM46_9APHY|nr:hypothetical protein OBBRIDRAFT_889699 [Obba rivulosa]
MPQFSSESGSSINDIPLDILADELAERLRQESIRMQTTPLLELEATLLGAVADIRSALNYLRPTINSVPVEILHDIFYHVPSRKPVLSESSPRCTIWDAEALHEPDCVRLMAVCRRCWPFETSSLVELNYCRSGGRLQKAHMTAISRTRELYWEEFGDFPSKFLESPAPHLHTLMLRADHLWQRQTLRSLVLFGGETPALRRLSLHSVRFLPSNNFTDLRTILLYYCKEVQPAQVLAWLAASPQIEDLVLDADQFSAWDGVYPKSEPLGHLQRLTIQSIQEKDITWLLAFPALTGATSVQLNNVTLIPEHSGSSVPTYEVALSATRLLTQGSCVMATGPSSGFLHISMPPPDLSQLERRIPLAQITEYWCDGRLADERDLFKALTSLETLVINHRDLPRAATAMLLDLEPSDNPTVNCPHLTTLRVVMPPENIRDYRISLFLDYRVRCGHPISRLIVDVSPSHLPAPEHLPDELDGCPIEWRIHTRPPNPPSMEVPDAYKSAARPFWPAWPTWES